MNVTKTSKLNRRSAARPRKFPGWRGVAVSLSVGTVLGLAGCQPAAETGTSATPITPLPATAASPAGTAAQPGATPTPAKPKAGPTLFVPGKDDLLHPHPFQDQKDPAKNLNQLIGLAPLYFPKGTRVLNFTDGAKQVTVDLSSQFNDQKFYSRGESITDLAVSTLVTSASTFAADPKKPVQLTVEGKPLSTLGEYDASDPIVPDHNLVAKS